MTSTRIEAPTLMGAIWPQTGSVTPARAILLALSGVALLTLSAKVAVPFYPVPMTMQSFMVLVIGAAYGWRLGAATVIAYLAAGAAGLPVFSGTPEKGIGLAYMMGPTGGYLLGFVAAAAVAGFLAQRGFDKGLLKVALAMFTGHLVMFAFGVAWLAASIGLARAWSFGVEPFYWATLLKTALAAAVLTGAWRWVGQRG